MRVVASVVLVLLLSGCSTPDGAEPQAAASATLESVEGFLHLEDCTGVRLQHAYPPGTNPAQPPTGWRVVEDDVTAITLYTWTCDRVGLDEAERPATILWEIANNADAPHGCAFEGVYQPSYLVSVLTDEPLVAGMLRQRYGLEVQLMTFQAEPTLGGQRYAWSTQGSPSEVTVLAGEPSDFGDEPTGRWVWETADGTGFMDYAMEYDADALYLRPATGTFSEPHRIGVDGTFSGLGSTEYDGGLQGDIGLGGPDCQ